MVVCLTSYELHVYLANEHLDFENQQGLILIIQLFSETGPGCEAQASLELAM